MTEYFSNMMIIIPAAVCLSLVLGSIPTGLWLGLWLKGVDIRKSGSGNIGATNTMRTLGKSYGAAALAFDVFKGWLPVAAAMKFHAWEYLPILCGLAAIAGHTFSIFVRFRGGKGVATSTGVFLGLAPMPMIVAGVVFFAVLFATRMVSAGSVAAAASMAATVFLFPLPWSTRIITVMVALLIIVRHQSNIRRILKHEEPKL